MSKTDSGDVGLSAFSKALKTQLAGKLGPGVKVTDGEGNVLHNSVPVLSPACAAGRHVRCKVKDCSCEHHGKQRRVHA